MLTILSILLSARQHSYGHGGVATVIIELIADCQSFSVALPIVPLEDVTMIKV